MGFMKDLLGDVPYVPPYSAFDGETYHAADDYQRLRGQLQRVARFMADDRFHTLSEIARATGGTEASVSARLRDLRKDKYGSRQVIRERVMGGLFRYRLAPYQHGA
jgi:hypothetical protein